MVGEKVPVDMRDRQPEASGRIPIKPGHELGWGAVWIESERRGEERGEQADQEARSKPGDKETMCPKWLSYIEVRIWAKGSEVQPLRRRGLG